MLGSIIEALILGIVQGLTEFIPVSSSGHLLLIGEIFSFDHTSFGFELALNLGTLLALLVYFHNDLIELARNLYKNKDYKLVILLLVSTIPALVVGGLFSSHIEGYFRNPFISVSALIVVGITMIFVDRLKGSRKINSITYGDAFFIGLAQVVAFIPGVSRSGITIVAARFLKITNEQAARYSFLMAIPIVSAALAKLFISSEGASVSGSLAPLLVGIFAAFISGLFAIKFMIKFLQNNGLKLFGVYRIIFAIVVLLLLFNN